MAFTTPSKRRRVLFIGSLGGSALPDELTTEVLVRLPVKSILRFRAVCRSWAAALSSEEFCNLHMAMAKAKASVTWPKLILISPSATFDSTGVYYPRLSSSSDPLFTLDDVRGDFAALTPWPCRGLTLLHDPLAPAYYVFNAATRAVTRLPPYQHATCSTAGLGFDAGANEYKVVRLACGTMNNKERIRCEVYVLGSGGEHGDRWRPAAGGVPFRFQRFIEIAIMTATWPPAKLPPVFADGCLHWLIYPIAALSRRPRAIVVSFSLKHETFSWIRSPPFEIPAQPHEIPNIELHLVELAGRLCMVRDLRGPDSGTLQIWSYTAAGDWSLWRNIDLWQHLEGDFLIGPRIIRVIGSVGSSTGKVILATSTGKVATYDPQSGIMDTIVAVRKRTSFYETSEHLAPRFSLFEESLAPVHKTNQEMALSSPSAKAVKEILLRLPGDFVSQFKLVCKQWLGLIESGGFIRSYHARNNNMDDSGPKFMLVGKGVGGLGFRFTPSKEFTNRKGPNQGAWLYRKLVCSKPCHGMNLISTETGDYLYNPCTGYRRNYHAIVPPQQVPAYVLAMMHGNTCTPEDHAFAVGNKNAGLGFDLWKQEHVVVQIFYHLKDFKSRMYFLTCSVIGLTSSQHNFEPPIPINGMPPAYVAGFLYWMSEPRFTRQRAIMSFDVTKKMFDVVPCPPSIAMWVNTSRFQAFVVELEGMLCVVLADPIAEELDIWKLKHGGHWDMAYKVYLEGWRGYSLGTNVVVPLIVDPRDGRILLNTGRKLGLYDPVRRTIETLYDLDEVLRGTCSKQSSRLGRKHEDGHGTKCKRSFKRCEAVFHGKYPQDSKILPLIPLLYEESVASYPREQKSRELDR